MYTPYSWPPMDDPEKLESASIIPNVNKNDLEEVSGNHALRFCVIADKACAIG